MSALARDLKFAFRQMRQTPIVSGIALLSLALGIGANVAIFSLVNALILKALPIHEPERLVQLRLTHPDQRNHTTSFTNPQWEYLRDHQEIFAGAAAVGYARWNLNATGEARPIPGLYVSGRFLDTLGVVPQMGRGFTELDDRRGGEPIAILSHGFWQREYGGDRAVLGRTVSLDGLAFTIVGVTPPEFFGVRVGTTFDVMVPLANEAIIRGAESSLEGRSSWWLSFFARLAPGQTLEQAEARLRTLQPQLREATLPQDWRPQDQAQYIQDPFGVIPAATGISNLRDRYSQPLYVLLGIVGLVLTIACANMANLLLAQSVARRRELAVRLSLGAGRRQLVRQLLVESLMLSMAGAAAGLLIAAWGSRALVAMLSTRTNFTFVDLAMDWRVFAFTAAVGVTTGLLFGVLPALRGTAVAPADVLRAHGRGIVSGGRLNVGHALVALQVALSFVLVFGSFLFVRTLVSITTQGMGFESDRLLIATVDLRRTKAEESARVPLFQQARATVAGLPGIEAVAATFVTPVSGSTWGLRVTVPGFDAPERDRNSLYNAQTPDYFRAMRTPILAGRDFTDADAANRPAVAIINEAFAKKYFNGELPIGKTFTVDRFGKNQTDMHYEVIGLVADAKYRTLREEPQPTFYTAMAQQPRAVATSVRFVIKTAGPPWGSRDAIVHALSGVNKEIAVDFRTLEEDMGAAVMQERLVASLSAFFGGLALLLAALGLYGVMSYSVIRRRNEIGIRMALGAEPDRVVALVLRHVALITVVGLIAGTAAAVSAGRFINTLLFNLATYDRTMIAITAVTLAAAAAIAGYLPARRAARIDPMIALREE